MQLISVKVHEGIDCAAALLFICSPWMFDFSDGKTAQWVPISIGIIIILMSLCTDYSLGAFKINSV